MALNIYDSTTDFFPKSELLNHWVALPQSNVSVNGKQIPSLYGNIKSVFITILMVCILIVLEALLAFQINDEGLGILAIIALSAADFIFALFPIFILAKKDPESKIDAQILVLQVKQHLCGSNESDLIKQEIEKKKYIKKVNLVFSGLIILLGLSKFAVYYSVLESDIFLVPLGRFILFIIIFGVVVHIYFTKIFFAYLTLFRPALKKQLNKWRTRADCFIREYEYNNEKQLIYPAQYVPASSARQFIGEKVTEWDIAIDKIRTINDQYKNETHFRINRIVDMNNVYLVYSGLLIDPEINQLFIAQTNDQAKEAVVAQCKEVQLAY